MKAYIYEFINDKSHTTLLMNYQSEQCPHYMCTFAYDIINSKSFLVVFGELSQLPEKQVFLLKEERPFLVRLQFKGIHDIELGNCSKYRGYYNFCFLSSGPRSRIAEFITNYGGRENVYGSVEEHIRRMEL